ncbi:hypothetical protein Glove_165g32 [Diversispora epigaea]|uniref:Uncharacterized protein n=1 Tax=Diversispora epigaea TaxID=1348612 RepID=A0A397IZF2_9GLOM|nr:hypothetical protein Glove_165g32 [Diversispora epigaea]
MSFRIKFNLPETATESLIKFIKLLLLEIGNSEFDTFSNSIYMTKKELGLRDDFYSFPTCPKCHKLYNKQEVENYKENDINSVMKCRYVEFPNSATRRNYQCQTILSEQVSTMDRFKLKFKLIYPFAGIQQQLMAFYNRLNFENFLRHCACSHDFGPLYAFWYFSFERMNRILGSLPNSYRQIEPELIINEMIYIENNTKGLKILNTCQSVGSLSEINQFDYDDMRRFWMYSRTIQESTISGKESFPGEMLKPFSENIPLSADGILNLMIAYYNNTYENLKFWKPFETDFLNSIIIPLKINKYCRCRIGSEIFGSTFSSRHQKSSYILAKFASEDDSIDIYLDQIQFFFVHKISTNRINMENHYLAYVQQMCNIELWDTEFYPKSRDCIIPVHHILGRFVPVKYKISDRKNAKEYLAVNPINRKYNLR